MDALEQQILDGILEKAEIEEDQLQNFTVDTLLFKSDGGENNLELDSLDALELIALLYETWEIEAMPEDLFLFGMIPEFVGRFPIFTALTSLDENQLVRLLTEPKNALVKQYSKLLSLSGVQLNIQPTALKAMAQKAVERGTGARALRAIFEEIMLDVMFDAPSMKNVESVTITKEVITKGKKPTIGLKD